MLPLKKGRPWLQHLAKHQDPNMPSFLSLGVQLHWKATWKGLLEVWSPLNHLVHLQRLQMLLALQKLNHPCLHNKNVSDMVGWWRPKTLLWLTKTESGPGLLSLAFCHSCLAFCQVMFLHLQIFRLSLRRIPDRWVWEARSSSLRSILKHRSWSISKKKEFRHRILVLTDHYCNTFGSNTRKSIENVFEILYCHPYDYCLSNITY